METFCIVLVFIRNELIVLVRVALKPAAAMQCGELLRVWTSLAGTARLLTLLLNFTVQKYIYPSVST